MWRYDHEKRLLYQQESLRELLREKGQQLAAYTHRQVRQVHYYAPVFIRAGSWAGAAIYRIVVTFLKGVAFITIFLVWIVVTFFQKATAARVTFRHDLSKYPDIQRNLERKRQKEAGVKGGTCKKATPKRDSKGDTCQKVVAQNVIIINNYNYR